MEVKIGGYYEDVAGNVAKVLEFLPYNEIRVEIIEVGYNVSLKEGQIKVIDSDRFEKMVKPAKEYMENSVEMLDKQGII